MATDAGGLPAFEDMRRGAHKFLGDAADSPAELASAAAEAVRALNHTTQLAKAGLTYPGDVYDVLGALVSLAARLPQTCYQLRRFLEIDVQSGRVVATYGQFAGDAPAAVATTEYWLLGAGALAAQLRDALSNAQTATAGLAHAGDDEGRPVMSARRVEDAIREALDALIARQEAELDAMPEDERPSFTPRSWWREGVEDATEEVARALRGLAHAGGDEEDES